MNYPKETDPRREVNRRLPTSPGILNHHFIDGHLFMIRNEHGQYLIASE
jgi:hypothetical protein